MPIGGTAFYGQNQSPRITTTYLNQLNRKGDPAPGVPVSTAQVSGSIVQPYSGFVGGKLTITDPWAAQFADPAVGPLYGGIYMYVQLDPSVVTPPIPGQVLFWSNEMQYIVTTNGTTAPGGKIAGIAVNQTTPGNWDFIQIAGIASVRFTAAAALGAMIGTTPAALSVGATATVVDKNYLGIAVFTAPIANAVSPVQLNLMAGSNF
jgi:hypothetical protein